MNEDDLLVWDYANIRLMDIRHMVLDQGDELCAYCFPASGYLYIVRGAASIRLNGIEHSAEGFHVIHSGKGGRLDIESVREALEYYLVLYKATLSIKSLANVGRLFESNSPFQRQFAYIPHDPLALLDQLNELRRSRMEPSLLGRIHTKSKLYQWIYEVEKQLQMEASQAVKPDLVEQAMRYIRDHYKEAITLSMIAERLSYSAAYVAKQFKSKTGSSMIDYLIQIRMEKAEELLLHTEVSLQEIAAGVGYNDLSYFIRIFKKTTGISPGKFRTVGRTRIKVADRPMKRMILSNAESKGFVYTDSDYDNHYQRRKGDDLPMYRNIKLSVGTVMLLCLTIMLSACSTAGGNSLPVPTASAEVQTNQQAGGASSVRLYTDSQGHEVSIPDKPQRIVLQGNSIGDLLALGVQPVGIDRRFIEQSVYQDKEQTPAQDIGFPTNLEAILDLEPDLTMLGYVMDKQYDEMSKIAPTVVFDQTLPLHERLSVIGEVVGKKAEAEQLLADYDEKASRMWDELRQQGKIVEGETAVVLIYYWNKVMYLMKTGGLSELLYQEKGYSMSDTVKGLEPAEGSPYIEVSAELMHEMLVGDRLFVLFPANPEAEHTFEELLESPLWQQLPSVQNGKVTFIETKWNYTDMLTSDMLLDEFPHMLEN
ncbi:helix-turn-helix domain-containing protein [Paenibacillus sp. NPDC057967]|uniref:helix-turn-helix domain-containing protein n=1 Tax=Paenibacillus sp. NPDC057967 TaxID=3346293 RepID=UPI0036D76BEF